MRMSLRTPRRAGAVLPLVTVCLVGLMAFIALAIDIGMMALARTQSQSAADIAALAGARTLNGQTGNNVTNAVAEALDAATSNAVLATNITPAQVYARTTGVYKYSAVTQRFQADFVTAPGVNEAYGAMQVEVRTAQPTFFAKVLGVNSMDVYAIATAVHRPRDVSVVLDFSGSMKFSSEYAWPSPTAGVDTSGALNPDDRFPRFGPWKIYPLATAGIWNPMHRVDAYIDGGGETHAANNLTGTTTLGPEMVSNFQIAVGAGGGANNALVYNGDLTGSSFNITNSPVCTPTPSTWSSQYAAGYKGDRWPLKLASGSSTTPAVADYAYTAAQMLGIVSVTTATRNATWETSGYDMVGLAFTNGAFQGYDMGPGYFGKSFYVWPPDPRYTAGADPTTINASNPVQDSSGKNIADWRKRFFLKPSGSAGTKGAVLDDNSLLFSATGVWKLQNVAGVPVNYVPNYDAILKWLTTGPKVLPTAMRAGRVLYYNSIPTSIPMDWATGLIDGAATIDQRFWKEYIDYVLGAGRHKRNKNLYGYGANNTWAGQTFGTGKITPLASLTGTPPPYMAYDDCPVHPRAHMWFGPLSMLGFLAIDSDILGFNWVAGTVYEAHCWQLKAGIQSALDDIKNNHPNDLAATMYFSSHNAYNTARVPMSRNYDKMKNALFYPYSLLATLGTVTSEKRPYTTNTINAGSPCGVNPMNYQGDVPNADGGTNPTMGLMVAYNQFDWNGGFTGRKGATKIVILETDGVANQTCNGTFGAISGGGGTYQWTAISNGSGPGNGQPTAMDPTITLAWLINQDTAGTKPWPTFPAYTNGGFLPVAGAPVKQYSVTAPGFSTTRQKANVHTMAFGYLFEPTTTSLMKTRALEFLRNIQVAGGLAIDPGTGTIEDYKMITGTYDQRIDKIRQALERILQGGIQVALIQ